MARRKTAKSKAPALKISVFPDLPGAVFYGDVLDEDVEIATHRQAMREEYESSGSITTLWHDLTSEGWPTAAIVDAVLNPATITSCGYVGPGTSLAGLSALVAA